MYTHVYLCELNLIYTHAMYGLLFENKIEKGIASSKTQ